MPRGGFEPPQAYAHQTLNLARLPIPPSRQYPKTVSFYKLNKIISTKNQTNFSIDIIFKFLKTSPVFNVTVSSTVFPKKAFAIGERYESILFS